MRSDFEEQRDWYQDNTDDLDTWARDLNKFGADLDIPIERDTIYIRTAERRGAWNAKVEGHGEASFPALGPMLDEIWRAVMSMPEERPAGSAPSASASIGAFPGPVSDSRDFLRDWAQHGEELTQ